MQGEQRSRLSSKMTNEHDHPVNATCATDVPPFRVFGEREPCKGNSKVIENLGSDG